MENEKPAVAMKILLFGVALLWGTPAQGAEAPPVVEKSGSTAVLLSVGGVIGPLAAAFLVSGFVGQDGSRPSR